MLKKEGTSYKEGKWMKKGRSTRRITIRLVKKTVLTLLFVAVFFFIQKGFLLAVQLPNPNSIFIAVSGAVYAFVGSRIFDTIERKRRYRLTLIILRKRCDYLQRNIDRIRKENERDWDWKSIEKK